MGFGLRELSFEVARRDIYLSGLHLFLPQLFKQGFLIVGRPDSDLTTVMAHGRRQIGLRTMQESSGSEVVHECSEWGGGYSVKGEGT